MNCIFNDLGGDKMGRSKIIKDLVNEKIPITVALNNLFVFSKELGNVKLEQWVKNELNGYDRDMDLPDYRKNLPYRIVYTGINGQFQVTNQPLPIVQLGEYARKIDSLNVIRNSIVELFDKESKFAKDLTWMSGEVYKKSGIQCISITLVMGKNISNIVISSVKTRVLESLILLESELGVLDDLYLGEQVDDTKKVQSINEKVDSILFANGRGV